MKLLSINIKQAGYEKDRPTIHDIHFSIDTGELVGLIGANGAGKSTTIKSILGLIPFLDGIIQKEANTVVSYLPERPVFYEGLTLKEHIDFIAAVEQLNEETVKFRLQPLLDEFNMEKHLNEIPATYSKGMQQKAMIILALMTQPELLIIDEPFIGLDPIATKFLLEIIQRERNRGVGILMCTHVLDTAEKICDRFLLINSGNLIANGTLDDFRQSSQMEKASLFDLYHRFIEGDINE